MNAALIALAIAAMVALLLGMFGAIVADSDTSRTFARGAVLVGVIVAVAGADLVMGVFS